MNSELDSYQVIRLMYDGLTDIDTQTDPAAPATVAHQAESYESNEDATVWTFTIREGLTFADGEPILPSSYVRSWSAPPRSVATTATSSTSSRAATSCAPVRPTPSPAWSPTTRR